VGSENYVDYVIITVIIVVEVCVVIYKYTLFSVYISKGHYKLNLLLILPLTLPLLSSYFLIIANWYTISVYQA
jgi:hypothetical protein